MLQKDWAFKAASACRQAIKEGHSSSELYNIQHVLFLSCIWEISEKHQHLFVGLRLFKVMNPTDFGE